MVFELEAVPAEPETYGRRIARIHPEVMMEEDLSPKDTLIINGETVSIAVKTWRTLPRDKEDLIHIDPFLFENTGLKTGEQVSVRPTELDFLNRVTLKPGEPVFGVNGDPYRIGHSVLDEKPVVQSEKVPVFHLETDAGIIAVYPVELGPEDVEAGVVKEWTQFRFLMNDGEDGVWTEDNSSRGKVEYAFDCWD